MPTAMSVRSRIGTSAPVASAAWRPSPTVHSAGEVFGAAARDPGTGGGACPRDAARETSTTIRSWLLEVSRAASRGQAPPPVPGSRAAAPKTAPAAAASSSAKPRPVAEPTPTAKPMPAGKAAAAPAPSRDDRKASKQARARQADATRPQRVELQRIEARLARLAAERTDTEAKLSAPGAAPSDYAELGRQLAHVNAETSMLEERWLALQGELA